jgi:hypothetical protein
MSRRASVPRVDPELLLLPRFGLRREPQTSRPGHLTPQRTITSWRASSWARGRSLRPSSGLTAAEETVPGLTCRGRFASARPPSETAHLQSPV